MTIMYREGGPIKVSEIHFPDGMTLKLVQPPMSDTEWRMKGEPWIVQIEYETPKALQSRYQTLENGDTLEFYTDKAGEHRWRLKAPNGEIVGAANTGFSSKDCAAYNFFRDKSKDRIDVYQTDSDEWRWRAIAVNGCNVGSASEGFSSRDYAVANAKRNGWEQAE